MGHVRRLSEISVDVSHNEHCGVLVTYSRLESSLTSPLSHRDIDSPPSLFVLPRLPIVIVGDGPCARVGESVSNHGAIFLNAPSAGAILEHSNAAQLPISYLEGERCYLSYWWSNLATLKSGGCR
jgi:hypothetical protein